MGLAPKHRRGLHPYAYSGPIFLYSVIIVCDIPEDYHKLVREREIYIYIYIHIVIIIQAYHVEAPAPRNEASVDVRTISALVFGVYIRGPNSCKLPCRTAARRGGSHA